MSGLLISGIPADLDIVVRSKLHKKLNKYSAKTLLLLIVRPIQLLSITQGILVILFLFVAIAAPLLGKTKDPTGNICF